MGIFDNLVKINYKKGMGVSCNTSEFFCVYLYNLLIRENKNILVVVNSLYEANKIYNSLQNYTDSCYLFPMDDFLTSEAIAISPDLKITRLETINSIKNSDKCIIITNLMGYLRFLPSKEDYLDACINISTGMEIDPKKLTEQLINYGYVKESYVTKTGEIGIRGFVIDIYPIGEDNPIRIEFFGDEIDSIRYFSPATQKSIKKIDSITINPFTEFICKEKSLEFIGDKQKYLPLYSNNISSISGYLDNSIVVYKDYSMLEVSYKNIMDEVTTYMETKNINFKGKYMYALSDIIDKDYLYYMNLNNISSKIDIKNITTYNVSTINSFSEKVDILTEFINQQLKNNRTIIICIEKNRIKTLLRKLNCHINETTEENIKLNEVNIIPKTLSEGFIYENFVFLTENELFIKKNDKKKYKTKFKYASKIKDINALKIGDYVVHNAHGIGIYNGIKVLSTNGTKRDYVEVLYKGKDKLYIPVEKIDLLYKFVGKEGMIPKVNKMDSIDWNKTKARVRKKVADMADQLLKLYAERESRKGYAFSKDTDLQFEFENDCPFELTTDQQIAVNQIKEDMEKALPMDRLLCGDVGFGKTEVAFRAMAKAVIDSKQVLLLCPTTILSNQHYENALRRFENFPANIALLNRFTTTKEVKRIKEGLLSGTIDIVIGTHRLLSDDIKPKDLGLLIIDEEQRFGVLHKEKIKSYKTNVDVLTLTATPIPRTLQMSMVGIRSLSLIETPPVNRYPVQTYVVEENNQIIKDAIYKELSRNGQVFILFNSVEKIGAKAIEFSNLVPDARVSFAHGRMTKKDLENKMISFINKEFDVLVCTTIIETGIDIPNANTLIILDADRFGLSQLYQIRGRVGRSNKFAYAYLMYHPSKVLTESATKRLNVIKEFTELGSGFSIATRDLSIRGAGDILGSEQAGFIDTVGIDLYLKMLNQEIAIRKGLEVENDDEDNSQPILNITTHIDDNYVSDESIKIEIHRKINEINNRDKLDSVKKELEDRFGKLNQDMIIYMYEEWFEKQIDAIGVKNVNQTKNYIELVFTEEIIKKLDTEDLFVKSYKISSMFRFKSKGNKLLIILDTIHLEKHPLFYLTELLDYIENKFIKGID